MNLLFGRKDVEKMYKILVADDEAKIRMLISDFLKSQDYEVVEAEDGMQALEIFKEQNDISLLILDVMMPDYDGWTVAREIRKTSNVPIIMLTARSEEFDEIHGFEIGADDYITKPFSPSVFMARVNAIIRRSYQTQDSGKVEAGKLYIDSTTHTVKIDGTALELTPKEYELLLYISSNPGKLFSREKLLTQVWGYDYFGGTRTVDTHIGRLRIKLGEYGEKYIKTYRGFGYKFEVQD